MDKTNEQHQLNEQEQRSEREQAQHTHQQQLIIDPKNMDNAVLKRLIGEIDFDKENRIHSYNRTHNRHNRGR